MNDRCSWGRSYLKWPQMKICDRTSESLIAPGDRNVGFTPARTATGLPALRSARTLFLGFRFIDNETPSMKLCLVECGDCLVRPPRHFHESKAAQATGLSVGNELNGLDWPIRTKQIVNLLLRRTERKIANVNVYGHGCSFLHTPSKHTHVYTLLSPRWLGSL